ncbi:MAG: ABC transporter permease [Gemmatimonadales bacterium]|jgi:ABC-type Na+ efflux pump permease subunit
MSKVLRIAKREYLAIVRTKGFVIGLVLAPVVLGGSAIAMALLEGHVDTRDRLLAVVDRSGVVAEALVAAAEARSAHAVYDEETSEKVAPAYVIEVVEPNDLDPQAQRFELSNRVRSGRLHAFIEVGSGVLHPRADTAAARVAYYAENAAMDGIRRWVERPINERLRWLRLSETGIETSAVPDIFDWVAAGPMALVSVDPETGDVRGGRRTSEIEALAVPLVLPMLMFLMMMMGAVPLLNAVVEEKSQRIAEVVLGSAQPSQFMAGKVVGGLAVSLTGSAFYIVGGVIALRHFGLSEHIPYRILPWFIAYMLMAVVMLGSVYLAFGSACNDAQEAQSLMLPAMLPVMIPMFVMIPVLREPDSLFATLFSLVPPFTPMLMLIRMAVREGVPLWQQWFGLAGMLAAAAVAVWAAGRIFRIAILMQGVPPKLGNLVRWAFRG